MEKIVGYQILYPEGRQGEIAKGYNYILAGDGVYIEATNELLYAFIPVAYCKIRGLRPASSQIVLIHRKIDVSLFDLALNTAIAKSEKEVYFAIVWQGIYHLYFTSQVGEEAKVTYYTMDNTIMDIHSHGRMSPFFSQQDDSDEQGLRLSCVVGNLDKIPRVSVRIGVYGNYYQLPWTDVFEGSLTGAVDTFNEEVMLEDEISETDRLPSPTSHWWQHILRRS
jgi:PRTRC genetic system protein A